MNVQNGKNHLFKILCRHYDFYENDYSNTLTIHLEPSKAEIPRSGITFTLQ